MSLSKFTTLAAIAAASIGLFGCGGGGSSSEVRLQGAGATFPNPLYQKWISEYGKAHANVKIDYQSIGSGGGIKQIQARTVDFGASDAPMTDAELKASPAELLHVPTELGAVVITYNLPGTPRPLRFSPDVVADIFLGKIAKWNDARIKADNADANLPASDITVVHRAESSGTSFVFTDYLAKVSADWKQKVGADKAPNWPVGQGGKGNEGVTGQIKQQPGIDAGPGGRHPGRHRRVRSRTPTRPQRSRAAPQPRYGSPRQTRFRRREPAAR